MKHSFCEDWEFTRHWTEAFGKGLPVPKQEAVRLPHTCREVPLHYAYRQFSIVSLYHNS